MVGVVWLGLLSVLSLTVATGAEGQFRPRHEETSAWSLPRKALMEDLHLVGSDADYVSRGQGLFHGKGGCVACHGPNGDISRVRNPDLATRTRKPVDLRQPSDKSVRQLYLIVKYGIPDTGFRDDEVVAVLSYVLSLQGSGLSQDEFFDRVQRREGEADRAMATQCNARSTGDSTSREACEEQFAERYRDLLIGRPADIPPARFLEIQAGCAQRFGSDLDGLAGCYRLEYGLTRRASR
jgi:mono/diheme cytochrome c family protein